MVREKHNNVFKMANPILYLPTCLKGDGSEEADSVSTEE